MSEDSLYEASSGQDAELRKDVLIGHLLRLVAGGRDGDLGILPNHALPAVASELCKSNLMPRSEMFLVFWHLLPNSSFLAN